MLGFWNGHLDSSKKMKVLVNKMKCSKCKIIIDNRDANITDGVVSCYEVLRVKF